MTNLEAVRPGVEDEWRIRPCASYQDRERNPDETQVGVLTTSLV